MCIHAYMHHDLGLYSLRTRTFKRETAKACPRMCLHTVLNEVVDAFNLMAPVCGSWSAVSRGSTYRSYCNPMGHQPYQAVSFGNRMISRFSGCSLMVSGYETIIYIYIILLYILTFHLGIASIEIISNPSLHLSASFLEQRLGVFW